MKLLIYFGAKGYNIMLEDGSEMEFVDGTKTQGLPDLKTAINICIDHDYDYEVI